MNRKVLSMAAAIAAGLSVVAAAGCSAAGSTNAAAPSSAAAQAASDTAEYRTGTRGPNPYEFLPKVPSFTLTSKTVRAGRPLPTPQLSGVFGVPGGKDVSPQLSWSGFPARTKSFVVSMYDPEAPTGSGFWHWVVSDIPAAPPGTPAGAFQLGGDAGAARYIGGAPPKGSGVHDYYITVTALDVDKSGVGPTSSGALLGFTIGSHTLARATIVCPTRG